jgi:hypothetical protein
MFSCFFEFWQLTIGGRVESLLHWVRVFILEICQLRFVIQLFWHHLEKMVFLLDGLIQHGIAEIGPILLFSECLVQFVTVKHSYKSLILCTRKIRRLACCKNRDPLRQIIIALYIT